MMFQPLNSLPNGKSSDCIKFKALEDDQINVGYKLKTVYGRVENIKGTGEKFWLPAFSPFSTMFSKAFSSRVVTSPDCVEKS